MVSMSTSLSLRASTSSKSSSTYWAALASSRSPASSWTDSNTCTTPHPHHRHNTHARMHAHTHTFYGPLSGTTQVSRYRKGKTNLDFTEAGDSEWQWHQPGHMQVCTSLQTDNHASTPPLRFLQARCPPSRPTNSVKALKATSPSHTTKNDRGWSSSSQKILCHNRFRFTGVQPFCS